MIQGVTILFCNCSNAKVIPAQTREEVKEKLSARGAEFIEVDDLCALAAERNPSLKRIADSEKLYIVACYPRAVKWLFHAAGAPLDVSRTELLNMRKLASEEVIHKIREYGSHHDGETLLLTEENENWKPWFPVIDFDRCSNCKQCLSFCLFGVFGIDESGTIEVKNPHKCKNDCPACSRVCPEVAIIFPKYGRVPINGSEVTEADTRQEPVKVDMSAMVTRGIHTSLRERSQGKKKRFSVDKKLEDMDEDCECHRILREKLGIPEKIINELTGGDNRTETHDSTEGNDNHSTGSTEEWGI